MKKLLLYITIIIFTPFVVPVSDLKAENFFTSSTWGVNLSPVFIAGPFYSELETGFQLSATSLYPVHSLLQNSYINIEAAWAMLALKESDSSHMNIFSMKGGGLYLYPLHRYFNPYGSMGVQVSYIHVNAEKTDITSSTYKPGLFIETGFMSYISRVWGGRLGLEYCMLPLSSRLFSEIKIKAGATYRHSGYQMPDDRRGSKNRSSSITIVNAQDAFGSGDIVQARRIVSSILEKDSDNADAKALLERIQRIEDAEVEARKMIRDKRLLEAIVLLEQSAFYYPESQKELVRIRAELSWMVPAWEKEGIAYYEKKDYDNCITTMKKIILVDPENSTAKIYLPRAQNRKKALESF